MANRLDGRQASLFPQPGGHPGTIVSGLVSSRAWMAEALGTTQDRLVAHFQQAAAQPLPWHERNSAPAQEVVHREGLDILKLLPVPTLNEHDSGPYISAGLMISRDPETGLQNVAILRCQISGPDRIGVLVLPRHTDNFYRKAEAQGRASKSPSWSASIPPASSHPRLSCPSATTSWRSPGRSPASPSTSSSA